MKMPTQKQIVNILVPDIWVRFVGTMHGMDDLLGIVEMAYPEEAWIPEDDSEYPEYSSAIPLEELAASFADWLEGLEPPPGVRAEVLKHAKRNYVFDSVKEGILYARETGYPTEERAFQDELDMHAEGIVSGHWEGGRESRLPAMERAIEKLAPEFIQAQLDARGFGYDEPGYEE